MFTGLIEEKGRVIGLRRTAGGARLRVSAELARDLSHGESVSVNGVCQTVVLSDGTTFEADVMGQTLSLTTLGTLRPGSEVNLERAMRLGDRMGGHMVTGHVDGVGTVSAVSRARDGVSVTVELPEQLARYVVARGSIAVDGISLTVAEVRGRDVTVALIPETLRSTVAGGYRAGDSVNIEADVMAKHQEKLLAAGAVGSANSGPGATAAKRTSRLTEKRLRELGFMERKK